MTLRRQTGHLLALLLVAVPAFAHLPEPFGRQFVREPPEAVTSSQAEEKPEDEASALERTRAIDAMEEELKLLQQEAGAYGGALTDPLLQLATMHERDGNAVAALRNLERALHLLRVNNGLLHPAQLPILRQIPELYRRIGDLESAQAAWRYAYRINGFGREPLDDDTLADTLAYFQFARDAFIAPGGNRSPRLLVEAYRDNEMLYQRYLEEPPDDSEALVAVALSHMRNLYIIMGIDLTGAAGPMFGDVGTPGYERLYSLQSLSLGKGLDVLDVLDEHAAPGSPLGRAQLLLERGNWLQWNGKWSRARAAYEATAAELDRGAAAEDESVAREARNLRDYLATPATLPEDPVLWRSLLADDMPHRGVFSASFRVTRRGNATEVSVTPVDDASETLAGRLRRLLGDSHYRPALGDTGPEESVVNERRYRLVR